MSNYCKDLHKNMCSREFFMTFVMGMVVGATLGIFLMGLVIANGENK